MLDTRRIELKEIEKYEFYKNRFSSFSRNSTIYDEEDISHFLKESKRLYDDISWESIIKEIGIIEYLINKNYNVAIAFFLLTKTNGRTIRKTVNRLSKSIIWRLKNNKYSKWYITRRQQEAILRRQISEDYRKKPNSEKKASSYVINIIDGTIPGGGLADRLRGIISTYAVTKQCGKDYRLLFTDPFILSNYFVPNEYDWRINDNEICKSIKDCSIIVLDTTDDSDYHYRKQGRYLKHYIKKGKKQTHVFTNAGYAYTLQYAKLFNELFKPSERLQKEIDIQKDILGDNYISVSARFLDLLGDFNETHGHGKALSKEKANELLNDALKTIEEIHNSKPGNKILVNSDSITFLNLIKELQYTYIIPGVITHIDAKQDTDDYEYYKKTFLDFMMIANASEIYLIKGKGMHMSGYPYAASLVYGRPFYILDF